MQQFIEAVKADDSARIAAFRAKDARMWFDQKTGPGEAIGTSKWRDWDSELHARHSVEQATIEDNAVSVVSREVNDFARLIDFPGWRATMTYWFNADGLISGQLYQPMDVTPSMSECFAPALKWARERHADDLPAIYPKDQFAPSRESAKRWRELLIEWRKASGRAAVKLSELD